MTTFAESNPEAAGDEPEVERGDAWEDLGGNPDNVRPIRPKAPSVPSLAGENVAAAGPRPVLSDEARRIIADIRRQLRDPDGAA